MKIHKKIWGQYVDFSKLLPKDRILTDDDTKLELVIRDGKGFWTQTSESVTIKNFARWEQAFLVYSNIYTRAYPYKARELIQYNHIIHSIAQTYVWQNVYDYDKEFRLHIARHLDHNWSAILQQAWSMKLRDRIGARESQFTQPYLQNTPIVHNSTGNKNKSPYEYCKRFNRGKCDLGSACKYEHKCLYCNKFGHGLVVCCKLIYDKEKAGKHDSPGKNSSPQKQRSDRTK